MGEANFYYFTCSNRVNAGCVNLRRSLKALDYESENKTRKLQLNSDS